jgi:succinate dehydrogenase / fumarate reductase flavoprotein subunit
VASRVFEREKKRQEDINERLIRQDGSENPLTIWKEMGACMTEHVTVVRQNKNIERADAKLQELLERYKRVNVSDRTKWSNQTLNFVRELYNMLVLARVIALGALARNESRGAHYKPDYPERDDKNWLKTTRAHWSDGRIDLKYEPVDTSLIPPRSRRYDVAK